MNIELIVVGKTDSREVEALVEMYAKRVNRYCRFSITTLADVRNTRNMAASRQKQMEGESILRLIGDGDSAHSETDRAGNAASDHFVPNRHCLVPVVVVLSQLFLLPF